MTKIYRVVAALCIVGAFVAFSASPALAHRGHVFGDSFGAPGSGAGQLSLTSLPFPSGGSGLAADEATHNLYVADTGNDRIDEFTSVGVFVRAWGWGVRNGASEFQICTETTGCQAGLPGTAPGEFKNAASVAVDNSPGGEGDVYVADYHQGEGPENLVQKFTAEGTLIETWGNKGQLEPGGTSGGFSLISGIAVTPAGDLLIGSGYGFSEFSGSSGAFIELLGKQSPAGPATTEAPNGFAIDGSGNFYYDVAADSGVYRFNIATDEPSEVWSTNGVLFTGLAVSTRGELYLDEGDAISVIASSCVSLCSPTTTFTSPLLTEGLGLAVDSGLEKVYIAEVAAQKIESIVPEPPAAPLVEAGSEAVSNVSGTSATLEAAIRPRSEPNEEPTSYRFQYTTEERFDREGFAGADSIPVPDGQLAPNYEEDLVAAHPQGLEPGTVYHYRVVAENGIGRGEGKPTEGERDEAGNEIAHTFITQTIGAFSLPDGRGWELVSPPNKHGSLLALVKGLGDVVQASPDGDSITYGASAPTESAPPGNANGSQVLSTRTAGAWDSNDISTSRELADGLGADKIEEPFFSSDLSLAVAEPQGRFTPLSNEASAQTPYLRTNYADGTLEHPCLNNCYRPLVTGAPGFANVPEDTKFEREDCEAEVLNGEIFCGPHFQGASPNGLHIVLDSNAPLTEGAPPKGLYEWTEGQLQLISILPTEGQPASNAELGGELDSKDTLSEATKSGAISTDGSRVVWSTGQKVGLRLYVRDVTHEETVELGGAGAEFQMANPDGSRIFFNVEGNLYVFEAPVGGALTTGHTTQLTSGGGVSSKILLGISQDGSSVYFVANTVLTGTPSVEGEHAQANLPNLYLYHAGAIKLVAVLSSHDAPDWSGGGIAERMTTTRVSPDGRWLAFMSNRALTGYDNRDIRSGEKDEEVFLYDATAAGGEGRLVCASCDPSGARPRGLLINGSVGRYSLVDVQSTWEDAWLAASLPAWSSSFYQSRYLSDSGRLFFDSADALVPSDTNATEDVYEYEPPGVGNCTTGSSSFGSRSGGCVGLISSGTGKNESAFLDASESGDDVFFLTSAQLSATDTDSIVDVYDAHVGGGERVSQSPPACEGDACQSPVAAPNDPTPGSLTYQGPGNPTPLLTVGKATKKVVKCAKGKRLSHGKCVKVKSIKKKAKKARAGKTVWTGATRRTK